MCAYRRIEAMKDNHKPFRPKIGGLSGGGFGNENLTTYSLGFLINSTVSASI
jgi:hypothetical protein